MGAKKTKFIDDANVIFQLFAESNITKNIRAFNAAKHRRTPYYQYLYQAGMRISSDRCLEPPSLISLVDIYYQRMEYFVVQKKIQKSDIIHPIFLFKDGKELRIRDCQSSRREAKSIFSFLMENTYYLRFLSHNHMPMSSPWSVIHNGNTLACLHDFAHLSRFMQNSNYMVTLRHAATLSINGKIKPSQRYRLMRAILYVNEWSYRIAPSYKHKIPLVKERYFLLSKNRRLIFKRPSRKSTIEFCELMLSNSDSWLEPMGAAVIDLTLTREMEYRKRSRTWKSILLKSKRDLVTNNVDFDKIRLALEELMEEILNTGISLQSDILEKHLSQYA